MLTEINSCEKIIQNNYSFCSHVDLFMIQAVSLGEEDICILIQFYLFGHNGICLLCSQYWQDKGR